MISSGSTDRPGSVFPYRRLVAAVDRHRRAILAAAALLVAASAASIAGIRLDMDLLAQLPARSEVFRDWRRYLESFGVADRILVLVSGDRDRLVGFADALAERLRRLPGVQSVEHRTDVEAMRRQLLLPFRFALLDEEGYRELESRLAPGAIEDRVQALRRALAMPIGVGVAGRIRDDPLGVEEILGRSITRRYGDPLVRPESEYLVSRDGGALLVIVRPERAAFDTGFAARLMAGIEAAEGELRSGPFAASPLEVGHTGGHVYALGDRRVIERDLGLYFVVAPALVLAVFLLGLGSLRILPFVTLPLVATTAITFALSALLFGAPSMIAVAFAGIFYGLGVDSSIYLYTTLRSRVDGRTLDRAALREAIGDTLAEIGAANVVASLTTAASFFIVGFSDFTGVSQLGVMTGVAMLLNVASTFVLLPAMILARGPAALAARRPLPEGGARRYGRAAARIARQPRRWLAGAGAVLVVALGAALRLRLDTDFTHLRPSGGEPFAVEEAIRRRFGAIDATGVVLHEGRGLDAALADEERIASRLEAYRAEGRVSAYSSLSTFLPSAATQRERLARFRRLPRVAASDRLRQSLAAAGFDPGAFAGFFEDWLRDDHELVAPDGAAAPALAAVLDQHLRRGDGRAAVATFFQPAPGVSIASIADRLRRELPAVPLAVTGRELAEGELARILGGELRWLLAAALVLNFAVVYAHERSLAASAMMLAPTMLAVASWLGIVAALDVAIDPVTVIVPPLLIGLGVDASVYLAAHARFAGDVGRGAARGFLPMALAVATTVAGFGSLALSRYPALARLGLLSALGLVLSTLATLVLVPAFLALTRRERGR
jgi:hypothetical protein